MHVHRSAVELVIQAPAKLNLWFEVLAKRSDGYHEIETLMCPIDLCDTLYFQDVPREKDASSGENSVNEIQFECRCAFGAGGPASRGLHDVPDGSKNLVVRAVELARRRAGVNRGAKLLLVKRIPSAAGLGGGSSDAAAALVAAGVADDLKEGVMMGAEAIDSGQAAATLAKLREFGAKHETK